MLSVLVQGVDNGELAAWLDREKGIMVRAGLHCAPAAHRRLGTFPAGTVRLSTGPLTRDEDLERVLDAIGEATHRLRRDRDRDRERAET